jgi:hypothetical protein
MYRFTGALAFFGIFPSRLDYSSLAAICCVTITKRLRHAAQFFGKSEPLGSRCIVAAMCGAR